jgi:hypothetical protein
VDISVTEVPAGTPQQGADMATATKGKSTKNEHKVSLTTGPGTISFPHLFKETASTNDKGEKVYDVQIIIPKTQREDIRAILRAIKEVGEAKWGANWKKVRTPLRDGDKEKDELTESGATKEEVYPERLGAYFLNARSSRPVAVVDKQRVPLDSADVYGGMKGKINVEFYPYSNSGNHGVGAGLNGVQKIADGEPFGSSAPAVESMFDLLDDEDDADLEDDFDGDEEDAFEEEEEETPAPKKRAAKKAPAKKAAAKKPAAKKAKPAPVEDLEDEDLEEDEDDDDLWGDLDDEDI